MNNSNLHEAIMSFFLKNQRPPTVSEIATRFRCGETDARSGLRTLAEYHGAVLHPKSDEIWVAHPFSAAPTTYIVRSSSRTWWGNCAWCASQGIPKGDVRPIAQIWAFATGWYGRHTNADWKKCSGREAAEISQRHGLTGPTWTLPDELERF